ncbi:MAG: DUF3800 domain-containing protein [Phycisphaerae bacterium]|nr:DUF3800 domain-containing protein [Phycisphaerae bacterium]
MLLFIDESGQDHNVMPCEVLAGVAVAQTDLWNLIKAIRAAEREHFGDYLRSLRVTEPKAKQLLKRKRFRLANQRIEIPDEELAVLAHSALTKGLEAHRVGADSSPITARELTGYSRSVLRFVDSVLDIAAGFNVKIIASVVDSNAAQSERDILRKDVVYLFERYFYLLKDQCPNQRGLVVFDELDKAKAKHLIERMAAYFLGTKTGRFRSSLIVPAPFFVHSELTTGVFLADLAAYVLGWAWRLGSMPQDSRQELKPFAKKLHEMRFQGQKPKSDGTGHWPLHGIVYLDDLRGRLDKMADEEIDAEDD